MPLQYIAPEPIKNLEDWFLSEIRPLFTQEVYVVLGYIHSDEIEVTPYDLVRVVYSGTSNRTYATHFETSFNFTIYFAVALPYEINPHRQSLAMLEKVRNHLWQKIPPFIADAYPLVLHDEKPIKYAKNDIGLRPGYSQTWSLTTRTIKDVIPAGDPCQGAGEPGSLIPYPTDYLNGVDDIWYVAPNESFIQLNPIINGTNQPYFYDLLSGMWIKNPSYDQSKPTVWGNLPFILLRYVKSFIVEINDTNYPVV